MKIIFYDLEKTFNTSKQARSWIRGTGLNIRQADRSDDNNWFFYANFEDSFLLPNISRRRNARTELRAHEIHNFKYDYLDFNSKTLRYYCDGHDGIIEQSMTAHFNGSGCRICYRSRSKREERIGDILKANFDLVEEQKSFDGCIYKKPLKFDFWVPSIQTLVEHDGEQHFRPIDFFGGEDGFRQTQIRDKIKNDWAEKSGLDLIRIDYDHDIETSLKLGLDIL